MESKPVRRRIRLLQVSLVWLGVSMMLAVFCFFPAMPAEGQAGKPVVVEAQLGRAASTAFKNWDARPDLVIVFTGQMHGYYQKCGCSSPQLGGLPNRYNFLESLRKKGWQVAAIDLGNIASLEGNQVMPKYVMSMRALDAMRYDAFGLGANELNMPAFQALANFCVSDKKQRTIVTNLRDAARPTEPFYELGVRQFRIIDTVNPTIGVYNVVDAKAQKQIKDPDCKFRPAAEALVDVARGIATDPKIKIRPAINIVLYQGTDAVNEAEAFVKEFDTLRRNNAHVPAMPIMVCLSDQSEPPAPSRVNNTAIYSVGHKGRYVGVLGLFKHQNDKGHVEYKSKFELVPITSEYDTPAGKEANNPVLVLLEEYAKLVKKQDYLGRIPRTLHALQAQSKTFNLKAEPAYVGSEACKRCHGQAFKQWKATKHADAFKALEQAKNPSLRQYDPECVKCHSIGMEYRTGYADKKATKGLDLTNVGCESCHGPGSEHVENPKNKFLREAMNPFSTREDRLPPAVAGNPDAKAARIATQQSHSDRFCQSCHDEDNDVHWKFERSWPKIVHYLNNGGPPAPGNPAGGNPGPVLNPIPPSPAPDGGVKIEPAPR